MAPRLMSRVRPTEQTADAMPGSTNCLVDKLSHYIGLNDAETTALARLQTQIRSFGKDEIIFSATDENQDLYIVQQGWLFNYIDSPDGRRQIINIYHPGDVIGFPDIALPTRTTNLYSVEAGSVCPFPKDSLGLIFKDCPRLAAVLLTIALREETILIDRLRIFSRMSAIARIGYLFLELEARLKIGSNTEEGTQENSFYMPMNQQEIGDTVGLTNVSVSRAMSALEKDGLIQTGKKRITLLKRDTLVELCDFKDRYSEMQTNWFPQT